MLARLSAFVIWAFVAGAAMFWGLRLLARPITAPPGVVAVGGAADIRGDLSRLLGAEQAPAAAVAPPESSRFRLLGVMAGKAIGDGLTPGVALISIDGKPARTFGAGARVDGDLTLQSLGLRTASIGPSQGPPAFVLEIPPLPPAATGTLAPPGSMSAPPEASSGAAPAGAAPPDAHRPADPLRAGRQATTGRRPDAMR